MFHTPYPRIELPIKFGYQSKLLFVGSCFSENIHRKLKLLSFNTTSHLGGTLYNPISISQILRRAISLSLFQEDELIERSGIYTTWQHHSDIADTSKEKALEKINQQLKDWHQYLKHNHPVLFITLGTSWVYKHLETKQIVANCHQFPATSFTKHILELEDIEQVLTTLNQELIAFNPNIEIVYTVSPVRHLNDGFRENTLSKSRLHLAIDKVLGKQVHYFPSYEIFIDDLRDYRFTEANLTHPNNLAVDYIFEKFMDTLFDADQSSIFKKAEQLQKMEQHKLKFPKTEASITFIKKRDALKKEIKRKIKEVISQY